ncbi:hypothetical protein BSKO_12580 [Bryopsis sp. KO-2023]|nr:hypothetical protein BSKO_12580 [Bryopsis sp. KO-2023]
MTGLSGNHEIDREYLRLWAEEINLRKQERKKNFQCANLIIKELVDLSIFDPNFENGEAFLFEGDQIKFFVKEKVMELVSGGQDSGDFDEWWRQKKEKGGETQKGGEEMFSGMKQQKISKVGREIKSEFFRLHGRTIPNLKTRGKRLASDGEELRIHAEWCKNVMENPNMITDSEFLLDSRPFVMTVAHVFTPMLVGTDGELLDRPTVTMSQLSFVIYKIKATLNEGMGVSPKIGTSVMEGVRNETNLLLTKIGYAYSALPFDIVDAPVNVSG